MQWVSRSRTTPVATLSRAAPHRFCVAEDFNGKLDLLHALFRNAEDRWRNIANYTH
jgi:hypothetical protein